MSSFVPRMGAWRLRLCGVFFVMVLVGCQQGAGRPISDPALIDDPPAERLSLGEPGKTAYAHLQDYLAVIRDPQRFDECLTQYPLDQPHLCMIGPRSGSLSGAAVHAWMQRQLAGIEGLQRVSQHSFSWPRFVPSHYGLKVSGADGQTFAPATYPWHFQGVTGPQGVSGTLVNLVDGSWLQRSLAGSLEGKIAIVASLLHLYASEEKADEKLAALAQAGAAGVIYAMPGPEQKRRCCTTDSLQPRPAAACAQADLPAP